MTLSAELCERLQYDVDPGTGCWLWSGARHPLGYGIFSFGGRLLRAHRAAWEALRGPIPKGLCVLHECDNPPCINPEHLKLGTKAENSRDMVRRGRSASRARHSQAKLSEDDVAEIKRLARETNLNQTEIGNRFGVKGAAVSRILSGKRWGAAR